MLIAYRHQENLDLKDDGKSSKSSISSLPGCELWVPLQNNLRKARHSELHSLKSISNPYDVKEDPSTQLRENL